MTSPAFLRAGLTVQRDLRAICNLNPVLPTGLDYPTLEGYWDNVPKLVDLVRKLTEWPTLPQTRAQRVAGVAPSHNPDQMPGYTVPYVCKDTNGLLTMQHGITLVGVLAGIRNFSYTKTRGYNETMRWENVLVTVPAGRQRNDLRTMLARARATFDPNQGDVAQLIRALETLPRQLALQERDYLQSLADLMAA